jgi:hypothetical protein
VTPVLDEEIDGRSGNLGFVTMRPAYREISGNARRANLARSLENHRCGDYQSFATLNRLWQL